MRKFVRNRVARVAIALASAGLGTAGYGAVTASPAAAESVCGYATVYVAGVYYAAPIPSCTAFCFLWQGPNEVDPLFLGVIDINTFECIQDG